jgi:prepilin-type N-terminal cleavage/methylation domain-containing protein
MYNVVGMWNRSKKSGFTLIEMLVTVAVMAVMAAGVASVAGLGSKRFARDADRQADIQTVASAVIMYRNDLSFYPECPGAAASCAVTAVAGLTPTYLQTIPTDSIAGRIYRYRPMTAAGGACDNPATRCARFTICAGSEKDTTTNNDVACGGNCGSGSCVFMQSNP